MLADRAPPRPAFPPVFLNWTPACCPGGWPRGVCTLLTGASPALGVLPSILTAAHCSRSAPVAWVLPAGYHLNGWLLSLLGADLSRICVFTPADGLLSWTLPQVLTCSHFRLVVVQADDPLTGRCLLRRSDAARLREAMQNCRAAVLLLRGPGLPTVAQGLPVGLGIQVSPGPQDSLRLCVLKASGRAPGTCVSFSPGPYLQGPWSGGALGVAS